MSQTPQAVSHTHIIDQFQQTLQNGKLSSAKKLLSSLHTSEIANLIEALPGRQRSILWKIIDPDLGGEVLAEVHDVVRADLLHNMQTEKLAAVTRDLESDDAAEILQDLPDDVIQSVLSSMDEQNRKRVISSLSYAESTAGRLMSVDVISVRGDVSLDVVSRYLRSQSKIPELTNKLMVVDRDNYFLGELALSDVLICSPQSTVGEWMTPGVAISADTSAIDVANLFQHRDLVSAAVINEEHQLLGRITIDDIVDVIQDEAEHVVRSMAGLRDDDMFAPVMTSARRRMIWLALNLVTVFFGSWVIALFQSTIEQWVALAILLPVVASMGGVAGSQTLIVAIRGIALGQIAKANIWALLSKELLVALLNGFVWAFIVAIVVIYWFENILLGLIIGVAMLVNLIVAAFVGATLPVALKFFRIDPAVAGGVLLTTVTDVIGFIAFLGLASLFLTF